MVLSEVFCEKAIATEIRGGSKEEVIDELLGKLVEVYPEVNRETTEKAIMAREKMLNTSIASGVAMPHGVCAGLNKVVGAIGFSKKGVNYGSPDGKPVHTIFLLLLGDRCREQHLRVLSRVVTFIKSGAVSQMWRAKNAAEIEQLLAVF
jgi:mannitol/fructose-specific phosphotransferase system IIA component (Ntr-type)